MHARHSGGGGPARAHTSAPTELVSVEPGFVHYPPRPLCGHRRPASCSFLSGSSRTTAHGGGREAALAGRRHQQAGPSSQPVGGAVRMAPRSRPPHRAQRPPSQPPSYQPAFRQRCRAGTARRQPHRPHAARANEGASATYCQSKPASRATPLDVTDGTVSSPTFSHPLVAARGRDASHASHPPRAPPPSTSAPDAQHPHPRPRIAAGHPRPEGPAAPWTEWTTRMGRPCGPHGASGRTTDLRALRYLPSGSPFVGAM